MAAAGGPSAGEKGPAPLWYCRLDAERFRLGLSEVYRTEQARRLRFDSGGPVRECGSGILRAAQDQLRREILPSGSAGRIPFDLLRSSLLRFRSLGQRAQRGIFAALPADLGYRLQLQSALLGAGTEQRHDRARNRRTDPARL